MQTAWICAAVLAALQGGGTTVVLPKAPTTATGGRYTDSAGKVHPWRVAPNHTLLWEDRPFLPVGGLFQVKSWAPDATDADFADDRAALQRLHAAGITDLYLQPRRGGISLVKPGAIQRVLDAVEAEGMTYGLSLADGPRIPLQGYHILPGRHRQDAPSNGGLLRFPVKNLVGALACMADPGTGQILETSDKVDVVAEGARVNVPPKVGRNVVVIYPERRFFPGGEVGLPNVWSGYDQYRDDLLVLLGQVRFGPGLRFFSDPLGLSLSLAGDARQVVPSDNGFAEEWAGYLSRRYSTLANLEDRWGITERGALKDYAAAARLVPLWYADKGLPQYYDRVSGVFYPARESNSAFWSDLESFKSESLRSYMSLLALALKRGVADVPVLYRSRGYSTLFTQVPPSGFDGVGIEAYGKGVEPVAYAGAETYSQVAEVQRPLWLPVLATQEARVPSPSAPMGFGTKRNLFSALDALRDTGARGFYVDALRTTDPARRAYDLSAQAEQLSWLAEYRTQLGVMGLAAAPAPRSRAVFYPRNAPLQPRQLADGAWWLPTDKEFRTYDFGASGRAYSLSEPGDLIYYLWNPNGPKQVRLKIPKQATLPGAEPITWVPTERGTRNKDTITLTLGPEPIRLYHFPTLPLPQDAFNDTATQVQNLLKEAQRRKMLDATRIEVLFTNIKRRYQPETIGASTAYQTLQELQTLHNQLTALLRPYLWMEAENATGYTFDQADERPGASGGRVLVAATRGEGAPPVQAAFPFSVNTKGSFRLYLAASVGASFRLYLDGQPYGGQGAPIPHTVGEPYAIGSLVWYDCGLVEMPQGEHTLELRADGAMSLDVVLLTPQTFTPNGPLPPPIVP